MHRKTVYFGEMPRETDFLLAERYAYEALGLAMLDLLGTSTLVSGLACNPSSPAALTVQVSPGRIYQLATLEPTVWGQLAGVGGLAADTSTDHQILKQGQLRDTTTLSGFVAPGTAGQSINYLIQASLTESDSSPVQREFWNTQEPTNPILDNVSDSRQDLLTLNVKAGSAATTGSQVTPTADSGYVPVWIVTVAYGQSTITSGNIAQHPSAPIISGVALQPLRLGPVIVPSAISANQNDYNPTGLAGSSRVDLSSTAQFTITGLTAPGYDGAVKLLRNVGAYPIVLSDSDSGSQAANRFSFGVNRTLQPNRSILLIYNGTAQRWRDHNTFSKAAASDIWTGTDDEKFVTSAGLVAANVAQTLTDAATIAWNMASGNRAKVTLGGNRTLGQPTGLSDGLSGSLQVVQDATGGRTLAFASCWDFGAYGAPTLSTGAAKRDMIYYEVIDPVTPIIRASFQKSA